MQRDIFQPTGASVLPRVRMLAAASVLLIGAAVALWPGRAAAQVSSGTPSACDFENNYCDFGEQSKVGDFPGARSSLVPSARSGSWAVRLHTEPGDDQVHGSGTWERDDLRRNLLLLQAGELPRPVRQGELDHLRSRQARR